VVVALREDEVVRQNQKTFCLARGQSFPGGKPNRISKKWIANLKWARDHNCPIRVVFLKVSESESKTMIARYPADDLVTRITYINSKTGEFRAESA
jgi:hypothetical protein